MNRMEGELARISESPPERIDALGQLRTAPGPTLPRLPGPFPDQAGGAPWARQPSDSILCGLPFAVGPILSLFPPEPMDDPDVT